MKGVLFVIGLMLLLGGGAIAAAQYAPLDLSPLGQAQELLKSQSALFVGLAVGAMGLILFIVALLPGKKKRGLWSVAAKIKPTTGEQSRDARLASGASQAAPSTSSAAKTSRPSSETVETSGSKPFAKAEAVGAGAAASSAAPAEPQPIPTLPTPENISPDPRAITRKRIADLVTLNDAIKAFHATAGFYPAASDGLKSEIDRGPDWIPGLVPDFLPGLPRDPGGALDNNGPQYFYVSDGTGYKLIAHGVGPDGSNVEILGVKIDPARSNDSGFWAYGFWTEAYAAF